MPGRPGPVGVRSPIQAITVTAKRVEKRHRAEAETLHRKIAGRLLTREAAVPALHAGTKNLGPPGGSRRSLHIAETFQFLEHFIPGTSIIVAAQFLFQDVLDKFPGRRIPFRLGAIFDSLPDEPH